MSKSQSTSKKSSTSNDLKHLPKEQLVNNEQSDPVKILPRPANEFKIAEREKFFWKLARPKFAVINFLCPGCRKINYKHPDQFKMITDKEFHFTQVMCPSCVKYNMIQTDYYNKHTKNPH